MRVLLLPLQLAALFALAHGSGSFIAASDLSYLPFLDCDGHCSPFITGSGAVGDALLQSKAAGITHIRVRLWVHPIANTTDGWPSNDYTVSNLTNVLAFARRIQAAGLSLWLDLHYSDVWADPGHQIKPVSWATLPFDALSQAVHDHTTEALTALNAQGTQPAIIQIGNEINAGMLWAKSGEPCASGGYLGTGCKDHNWPAFAAMVSRGQAVARALTPGANIMVHTSLGSILGDSSAQYIVEWYQNLTLFGAGEFDSIGLSYYPHWGAGSTENVKKLALVLSSLPTKQVFLAETSYPYQGGPPPAGSQFPFSMEGQLQYTKAILQTSKATGLSGVAWWGGEYFNYSSGAGWTALWDKTGLPTLALGPGVWNTV